jgi:hypothetical protein
MNHLKDIGENYFIHAVIALSYSITLLALAVVVLIHGIIPFVFVNTASNGVSALEERMEKRRLDNISPGLTD